jgi:UDP-galactopyranose mutase
MSHLRWDFVFQRPNHLMTRFARDRRVFFIEEWVADAEARLRVREVEAGVRVVTPVVTADDRYPERTVRRMLDGLKVEYEIEDFLLWYFTPMALETTRHLKPRLVVYDCMDELTGFDGAPTGLRAAEDELLERASVVFTGGQSLYEAKKGRHANIHPFPSSVDVGHFARARRGLAEPDEQAMMPRPRVGFFGVLDERLDRELLRDAAALRPDWSFILVGPTAKIAPESLPRAANLHYLGPKRYDELPSYLAGWDVTMIPFARNDATRFISPTKTLEYMAAGKPVVSTSIADVVCPFGERGLVRIGDDAAGFVSACEELMASDATDRLLRTDDYLSKTSWERTWQAMSERIETALEDEGRSTRARRAAGPMFGPQRE